MAWYPFKSFTLTTAANNQTEVFSDTFTNPDTHPPCLAVDVTDSDGNGVTVTGYRSSNGTDWDSLGTKTADTGLWDLATVASTTDAQGHRAPYWRVGFKKNANGSTAATCAVSGNIWVANPRNLTSTTLGN